MLDSRFDMPKYQKAFDAAFEITQGRYPNVSGFDFEIRLVCARAAAGLCLTAYETSMRILVPDVHAYKLFAAGFIASVMRKW